MTVLGISKELLSIDALYRTGRWNAFLRQPHYGDGVSELYRAADGDEPEMRIPLVYDYAGAGGFHMYYIPSVIMEPEHEILLKHQI